MKLKALSTIKHDGKVYQAGELLDVRDRYATPLVEGGVAVAVEDEQGDKTDEVSAQNESAEPVEDAPNAEQADGSETTQDEDLSSLSRADLNARAEEVGVTGAASMPNKQAVIDAILEAEQGQE